jgi:hypothetical protein
MRVRLRNWDRGSKNWEKIWCTLALIILVFKILKNCIFVFQKIIKFIL